MMRAMLVAVPLVIAAAAISDPIAAQAGPLEGRWVAVGGFVRGEPIADAALPFIRFEFDGDSASWTIPGYPQSFGYRAYGSERVDSIDFELPSAEGQRWIVPARAWQRGDTLELALRLAGPLDAARGAAPSRPAERGPVKAKGRVHVALVREPAAPAQPAPRLSAAEAAATEAVDAQRIERRTRTLVAPEMEGRGSGQPGGERAARAIAGWFEDVGLEPLGEDGFLQRVPLILGRPTASSTLTVDDTTLHAGTDFVLTGLVMRTRPAMRAVLEGELVLFAGGVPAGPAVGTLPRFDVAGKVVAWVLPATPPGTDVFRTYRALHESGAAGIILMFGGPVPPPLMGYPLFSLVPALDADLYDDRPGMPAVLPGPAAFAALFGDGSRLPEFAGRAAAGMPTVEPTGRRVTLAYELEDIATAPTYNVVGVIRGSDPELRDEAVVYTAHYDALGVFDGTVYPGAADNALGVAELMEIARALRESGARPRRSVVFIAAGAEERGVLGSLHWVRNPAWPLEDVVANVNLDGGDAEAFGPLRGVIDLVPSVGMGDRVAPAAAAMGVPVLPNDSPPGLSASDFLPFMTAGIPATQLMGIGGDPALSYQRTERFGAQLMHQPGDVIGAEWDWAGPRQMAQIYLLLGLRLANADERPERLR